MRVSITTTDNATNFMRRAGYGFQKEGAGEIAFRHTETAGTKKGILRKAVRLM